MLIVIDTYSMYEIENWLSLMPRDPYRELKNWSVLVLDIFQIITIKVNKLPK